ncbi:MAG: hypothetical protein VX930_17195 [Pseudomonadota bacterium]|nr:hypothetical protein [Pseudomonadota bacterium]
MADISPALPAEWPGFDDVRGTERGDNEQRILRFQISAAPDHHRLYRDKLMPVLAREGAELIGLFNTLVGVSTTNRKSMQKRRTASVSRSCELAKMRDAQDDDPTLSKLVKQEWMRHLMEFHSVMMPPLDYSRIR